MPFRGCVALDALQAAFPELDLSKLHVTLPPREDSGGGGPQPLPPELASVSPADTVDLRKYCSPIGDQGQLTLMHDQHFGAVCRLQDGWRQNA